jgi:SAM-dependent MidA family methyltransferase
MPFSRYMELCLYDPVEGYYTRNSRQFGKAGDFYTSSDVHAVFGRLLARQFEEMWRALDRPAQMEILELGPGRGLFARDVLDWSRKKFPDFFAALIYTLQESSAALRARLEETLAEHISTGKAQVSAGEPFYGEYKSSASAAKAATENDAVTAALKRCATQNHYRAQTDGIVPSNAALIVFANELFDALPVEILSSKGKLLLALEHDALNEIWLPATADELEFLDRYGVHPEGNERVEVSLAAQKYAAAIGDAIDRGFFIAIDYGYTRAEQLAGRHRGTLMAYRQHSASANPYEAPGEQDLTAHVNFTALTATLEQAGLHAEKLITQSQFLMGIGEQNQFADAFEDCRLPQEHAKVVLQLKHLISPEGMGETFRVLIASREIELTRVSSLSGLRFG